MADLYFTDPFTTFGQRDTTVGEPTLVSLRKITQGLVTANLYNETTVNKFDLVTVVPTSTHVHCVDFRHEMSYKRIL